MPRAIPIKKATGPGQRSPRVVPLKKPAATQYSTTPDPRQVEPAGVVTGVPKKSKGSKSKK